jgi:ParB-like chromosome segregation protein Spo0J
MRAKQNQKTASEILAPISNVMIVDRSKLKPNDYNPNKVLQDNLDLLVQSIMANGWTMPIVVRSDFTIIDGFHRWTVAGQEPLKSILNGKVPVVVVHHKEATGNILGTITHNRARGTHLLEPMERIVQDLLKAGKTPEMLVRDLGMSKEEVYRLSGFTREDFLRLMTEGKKMNTAYVIKCVDAKGGGKGTRHSKKKAKQ